jgi:hypothetical protein
MPYTVKFTSTALEYLRFVLAPIDYFALEVELLRNNQEFMDYLDEISQQKATISLAEVEKELGL